MGKDVGDDEGAVGLELRRTSQFDRVIFRVEKGIVANIHIMPGGSAIIEGVRKEVPYPAVLLPMHIELMSVYPKARKRYPTVQPAVLEHQVPIRSISRFITTIASDGVPVPIKDIALD